MAADVLPALISLSNCSLSIQPFNPINLSIQPFNPPQKSRKIEMRYLFSSNDIGSNSKWFSQL